MVSNVMNSCYRFTMIFVSVNSYNVSIFLFYLSLTMFKLLESKWIVSRPI